MFVYISLYTCPFTRLFVHLSHVGILSTVDTTQHIRNFYRTAHMHSADYAVATCLSDHSSLCLSDSPSVCHTTGLPPCTGRKNRHIWNKLSVYHVHSYVSVCLSATTIRPFRTFLRLSVDLRVFVYVYFHANILHVQLLVFQCAVVVTINTVAVSIIFEPVVNIASKRRSQEFCIC